jgi:hypothetical protein
VSAATATPPAGMKEEEGRQRHRGEAGDADGDDTRGGGTAAEPTRLAPGSAVGRRRRDRSRDDAGMSSARRQGPITSLILQPRPCNATTPVGSVVGRRSMEPSTPELGQPRAAAGGAWRGGSDGGRRSGHAHRNRRHPVRSRDHGRGLLHHGPRPARRGRAASLQRQRSKASPIEAGKTGRRRQP